jgi:hypothetical protein
MRYEDLSKPRECRVYQIDSQGRTYEVGTAYVYKERLLGKEAVMPVVA